jgi:hypothetical protein
LDEDVSAVTVAGLGDGTSILAVTGGVFAGHEADVGHEPPRGIVATQVAEFGAKHHGRVRTQAPEPAESIHGLLVGRGYGELLDLSVQLASAIDLVLEQSEVFAEHVSVFDHQLSLVQQSPDPVEMLVRPVRAVPKDETPAPEELQDVVPGLQDLALEGLPAAHEVADPFLGLTGDANRDQQSGPVLTGELNGVESVMFAAVAGPREDECRSDHLAGVTPSFDRPLEDITGTARLVAALELSVLGDPRQEAPECALVVRQLLDDGGLLGGLREHSDHHGVRVDIHPDVNLQRRCGHGSVLLGSATLSVACGFGTPATTGANPR